jgi:hypothetical protein
MTGGLFTAVAMTVVAVSEEVAVAVSVIWIVNPVVTEPPGATWCVVGASPIETPEGAIHLFPTLCTLQRRRLDTRVL